MISVVPSVEDCYYRRGAAVSCSCLRLLSMIQCLVRMSLAASPASFRGRWAVPLCCSCGLRWKRQHRWLILTSVHTHVCAHTCKHAHSDKDYKCITAWAYWENHGIAGCHLRCCQTARELCGSLSSSYGDTSPPEAAFASSAVLAWQLVEYFQNEIQRDAKKAGRSDKQEWL